MKETKSWRVCAKTATAARLCVDCHPQKQTECKQTNWYETETGGAKNGFVQKQQKQPPRLDCVLTATRRNRRNVNRQIGTKQRQGVQKMGLCKNSSMGHTVC